MDIMKIAGFAVASAMAALLLRRLRPEMGIAVALSAGLLLLGMAIPAVTQIISGIDSLAVSGGVSSAYMTQLLKIAGVALLADLAAQTCRDAGEDGIAARTELAGRVMILTLSLPTMRTLLGQILSLTP